MVQNLQFADHVALRFTLCYNRRLQLKNASALLRPRRRAWCGVWQRGPV